MIYPHTYIMYFVLKKVEDTGARIIRSKDLLKPQNVSVRSLQYSFYVTHHFLILRYWYWQEIRSAAQKKKKKKISFTYFFSFPYWHSGINRYNLIILLQNHIQTEKQRAAICWRTGQQTHLLTGPMAPNKHRFVISPHGAAVTPCNQKPSTTVLWAFTLSSSSIYSYAYIISLAWSGYVSTLHQPIQLSQAVL